MSADTRKRRPVGAVAIAPLRMEPQSNSTTTATPIASMTAQELIDLGLAMQWREQQHHDRVIERLTELDDSPAFGYYRRQTEADRLERRRRDLAAAREAIKSNLPARGPEGSGDPKAVAS